MAQSPSIFITALEARQSYTREKVIHEEARLIESAILDASKLGLFEVTVSNGTPMTNSNPVLNDIWSVDPTTDQLYVPRHTFSTGDIVTVGSTGSLPSPLSTSNFYYVIYVDDNYIKLSSTYENALSNKPIAIDITSGVSSITLDNQGSGYIYSPIISFTSGSPVESATASATLASYGNILDIFNTTPGSGYTDVPTVSIVSNGSNATAGVIIYKAVNISVVNPGNNYHVGDILTVTGGTFTINTTAIVSDVDMSTGSILSVSLSNPGKYTGLPSSPTSTVVIPGGGQGATVSVLFGIESIMLSNGGSGYTSPPLVKINSSSGTGATAISSVTGGTLSNITVTNPGISYNSSDTTVEFITGSGATAIARLQPTSIQFVNVSSGGSGYSTIPSVTISSNGTGASIGQISMSISSCELISSGIDYIVNDTLLISGGTTDSNAYIRVRSVDTFGRILTYTLESGGSYTMLPPMTNNLVNGGSGQNAVFNLSAEIKSVEITSSGNGYLSPPIVEVTNITSAPFVPAELDAILFNDEISSIFVRNPGAGYKEIPLISFKNGSGATAVAHLNPTSISSISVLNAGNNYTYANVIIQSAGETNLAIASANIINGQISSITITSTGSGYTSIPDVIIEGDGFGATAKANLEPTSIASIELLTPGNDYTSRPLVTISGNGSAQAYSVLSATGIERISIVNRGSNYVDNPSVYLIPGLFQTSQVPISPILGIQRGFSIKNIGITNSGVGYQSPPAVIISPPLPNYGISATATALISAGTGTFYIKSYTSSRDYFKVWKNMQPSNSQFSRPYKDRMDTVIAYFTNMGYTINRITNPVTGNTLSWNIQW